MAGARRIEELEAEARYQRERFELYKAKQYSERPTSDSRMRELERLHQAADARLLAAREEGTTTEERGGAAPGSGRRGGG
jgi:hypothetical protein